MAHSTAAMVSATATTGEIYLLQEANGGKLVKVVKSIKQEPLEDSIRVISSNMGAYNMMGQPKIASRSFNTTVGDNAVSYPVISTQNSSSNSSSQLQLQSAIKYEPSESNADKADESYAHQSNAKTKSKLHAASLHRKRKPEKAGKGLRHFSMKVCEKVKEKGTTTYNEVADELVNEELAHNSNDSANCDQKNIRRRVYDALNVLMAIGIISKDKKQIHWIGLPSNSVEQCYALEKENKERHERIKQKHQQLRELLLQHVAFKNLVERNRDAEDQGIVPTPNSSIQLPFFIVNTHKSTKINCSVTNDKSEYIFKFDDNFEMHDDAQVLKRMGLHFGLDKGQCTMSDIERAKALVPYNFAKYIEAYGKGGVAYDSDDETMPCYAELTNDGEQGFDDDEEFANSDID